MKTLKIIAALIALLVIVTIAGVAYLAATFDPNSQRARIVELVKEKTGRDLHIDGDLKLTFFPRLGVALGRVALSEKPSAAGRAPTAPFVQIESARASLRVLPLLAGRVAADRLVLTGLTAELVRHRDGSTNFDDLFGAESGAASAESAGKAGEKADAGQGAVPITAIDVAGIEITGANVGWRDERDGSTLRLSELSLKTGRIVAEKPGELTLSGRIATSKPELALQAELTTGYRFEPGARSLHLSGFTLMLRGDVPGAPGLDVTLSAVDAAIGTTTRRLELDKLRLIARHAGGFTAVLTVPRLSATPDRAEGDAAALTVNIDRPGRKLAATAELTAPSMNGERVSFERLGATIDLLDNGLAVKGEIGTPIMADLAGRTVYLPQLAGKFRLTGEQLPADGVALEISGGGALDWGRELATAELSARLDQSNLKAKLRSGGFSTPLLELTLSVDRLDLDRYLPAKPAKDETASGADTPVELGALASFNGSATLRAGSLTVKGVTATDLNLGLRGSGGKLQVEPLRAGLYGGKVQASARADAASGALSGNGALTGVEVGPLLHDLAKTDVLTGRGNARFALASRGTSVAALKRALGGTASIALRNGAVKGINLAQAIRKAKSAIGRGGTAEQGGSATEQTDFSALDASFVIKDGVARNDDLALKSPLLRVGGAGSVDIGAGSVDYLLKTTVVGSLTGQDGADMESLRGVTIPVKITGPFEKLSYRLDFSGAVADAAKQKLRSTIEQRLGIGKPAGGSADKPAPTRNPADLLKGLLGR